MGELGGKVAIVTGGSSGIGRGAVEKFLSEGARVVIADIDADQGEAFAAHLGADARFCRTDVADQDQLRRVVDFAAETFGRLDVMLNNAGISGRRVNRLADDPLSDFQQVMGINLLGVMAGTREAARQMAKTGGGSIINISSVGGINPAAGNVTYHVAKAGVIMFTKCAAVDLGEYKVRVNCIAPGNIETPILEASLAAHIPHAERAAFMANLRKMIMARQPLQMQGTTEHLADACVFLASDRSAYITGSLVPVDGGMAAGVPPAQTKAFVAGANFKDAEPA
jgi:NAD(P)-dependent dehydrogenase (short-subunit alcohol dehydrogenase family)